MKKILIGLIAITLPLFGSSAIEFETIKTKENPGFFLVKVFPSDTMTPFKENHIFILSKKDEYQELQKYLQEKGEHIESEDWFKKNSTKEKQKIVLLGKKSADFLSFTIENEQNAIQEFEEFKNKNLSPVFLKNIQFKFGGNVKETIQQQESISDTNPLNIVGKFKKNQQTRIEITGETPEGITQYSAFIPLHDKEKANDPLSKYLPELWENIHNQNTQTKETTNSATLPIILFLVGLFIILWVIWQSWNERRTKKKNEESFLKDSPETIKKSPDNSIPFEIVINEKKK